MSPKTLYDKIWDAHVAHEAEDGTCLLYIDRHLVHEVTSPQAFEGLRMAGRKVHAPDKTIAVPDHNVPATPGRDNPDQMPEDSRLLILAPMISHRKGTQPVRHRFLRFKKRRRE